MSLATKNVASVLVGSVLVLALSFAIVTPAKADMLSDLQAQVAALLAQITALGGSSTTTGAGCYAFTQTHQLGQSGGEVMWVQKFLNSHGAQIAASGAGSPGNETAYYGGLTKAAVAKWQAANGVTPAAGYWGPVTRAKVATVCASTPTTPTTPTTGGEVLNGSAGSITVTTTSADVEDEVFTATTEKVLGFKVQASGADVRVTNVRVKFTAAVGSAASDRLADYASEISVWAAGQKIASMSPSSFVRDSAGVYSASIPVAQVVRMGSSNETTFHVGLTALSSIDSDNAGSTNDWTAELVQTRYVDPTNATLFDTTASISNAGVYVSRLSSSSDVELRMAEGSGNPKTGNVKVNESGTTEVTLAEFTLKAEGAEMEFDTFRASTTITGETAVSDMVQEFYLMRGSTRLDEVAGSTGTSQALTFSLSDTETIAKDATQTYRIVAKLAAITPTTSSGTVFDQGDTLTASTSATVWNIDAKSTADGKSVTNRAGSVTTYTQTFYSEGIQVTKVGESFTLLANDTAASVAGEFKVTLRVTNFGSNDVYIPLNALASTTAAASGDNSTSGFAFYITNGTTGTSTAQTGTITGSVSKVSGGTEKTNSVLIGGGSSADFQVTASFNPDAVYTGTQQYRLQVVEVGHAASDTATAASFVATTPLEDFRTIYYTIQN